MKVIISDTHFGTRQNSITWLHSQEDFIYKQLIPFIKSQPEEVTLVHLGDVFDSRSSVSTYIASRVIKMFESLKDVTKEIIIVSGNHDYYSPNSDKVNTNAIILQQIGLTILSKEIMIRGEDLYVPWYCWFDQDKLVDIVDSNNIKNIFTHADLHEGTKITNARIFSGHIHTPHFDGKKYTLGSTYPLTFADADQDRGFYTLDDYELKFHPNTESIRFFKSLGIPEFEVRDNDYINLYIDMTNESLLNDVKSWIKTKKNCTVFPLEIQNDNNIDLYNGEEYNIENICKELIPDHLIEKFESII